MWQHVNISRRHSCSPSAEYQALLLATDVEKPGFIHSFDQSSISSTVCGGHLDGSDHGEFDSPGYPGQYPHNRDCVWTVAVSPGNNIVFSFAHLSLEEHSSCNFDYLEVRTETIISV